MVFVEKDAIAPTATRHLKGTRVLIQEAAKAEVAKKAAVRRLPKEEARIRDGREDSRSSFFV